MKKIDARKLADEIAEYLFTNGSGQKAVRLVLELNNGKNGGGWSKEPARDAIASIIKKTMKA